MMSELEDKYSRFNRYYDIDIRAIEEAAFGGGQGEGGVTDHGQLNGLLDDDHPQYLTQERGDARYSTRDQLSGLEFDLRGEIQQKTNPPQLDACVDGVTVVLENGELVAKTLDGLLIGVSQVNDWLSGTQENIQVQINGLGDKLMTVTSGMSFQGKVETYQDLTQITNLRNGNLVVVLADESRSGGRSMYVYSEDLGAWEFIGEFVFSDEFIELQDTPASFSGSDGKVVKVDESNGQLVFSDVDYAELKNKPSSSITQIDDAVAKKHSHSNADILNRLGIDEEGRLTIDGVAYVPDSKVDPPEIPKKQHLHAGRSVEDQTLSSGSTLVFDRLVSGDIHLDRETGVFTLEGGKEYRVTFSTSMITSGYVICYLVDSSNTMVPNGRAIWTSHTATYHESSSGPLDVIVRPSKTEGYSVLASSVVGATKNRAAYASLIVQEL